MILAGIVIGTKKEGESCGEGHGELGWQKCGQCAEGLECEESTFVIPRCMTCKRKTGKDRRLILTYCNGKNRYLLTFAHLFFFNYRCI